MDIELEKLKKLEEALSDCVDILRDCQVDKTCYNCKHSDLPGGYEPCVYCRNKDDWEPKESSCPCEDGIDSKSCVGCEHSEDGKPEYKPYESVEEFIQDYQKRFPAAISRPAHTMPLIWIKNRQDGRVVLVHGFNDDYCLIGTTWITVYCLYENWTYLDGSPCGKEC